MLQVVEKTRVCKTCKMEKSIFEFRPGKYPQKDGTIKERYRKECRKCEHYGPNVDRECSKCRQYLTADHFTRGGDAYCTKCQSKYRREKVVENKLKALGYMGGVCADCHKEYPYAVYDFHHKDPSQKDREIASMRRWSWENIKKELDKCVMLCANCHRMRHLQEEERRG